MKNVPILFLDCGASGAFATVPPVLGLVTIRFFTVAVRKLHQAAPES